MAAKICAAIEDNSARRAFSLWFQNFVVGYIEYSFYIYILYSIFIIYILAQFPGCISLDHVFDLPLIDFGILLRRFSVAFNAPRTKGYPTVFADL